MKKELRCPGTMHGKLDGGFIEVKCRRSRCGYEPGVVVLHRFDVHTGELADTRRFAEPPRLNRGNDATR